MGYIRGLCCYQAMSKLMLVTSMVIIIIIIIIIISLDIAC